MGADRARPTGGDVRRVTASEREAGSTPAAGAPPEVDLRLPRVLLIWPVVFTTCLVSFLSVVLIKGSTDDSSQGTATFATVLVVMLFMVLPIFAIAWQARSSVRSFGTTLRVRSGFITRLIPAEDIVGFPIVDQVGRRRSFLPARWAMTFERPAIALRPGSPSDISDQAGNRGELYGRIRRASRLLGNRWGRDLPLTCLPAGVSARRMERAIAELEAWHRWALRFPSELT